MFGRKKQPQQTAAPLPRAQTVPRAAVPGLSFAAQTGAERELFRSLRESVPVIDAAVGKLVRLVGGFKVVTDDPRAQEAADRLTAEVKTNASACGLAAFAACHLDSLLTYGEAVGEMLLKPDLSGVYALYNASLDDVSIRAGSSPLEPVVYVKNSGGETPAPNQELVLVSLLNQRGGSLRGESLLSGLPFVSGILLRIFESVKNNWERAGDVRFAVTYDPRDGNFSEESARLLADEWRKAMRSDTVCDFVSAGDVKIKVIGAENQIPDCQVPVRMITEQIVAKLGVPPFLLGLSWSSTERMSAQQADILTSEIDFYRASVEPALRRIIATHLRLSGFGCGFRLVWNDVNLQDAVELSTARLNNAKAAAIEKELGMEVINGE